MAFPNLFSWSNGVFTITALLFLVAALLHSDFKVKKGLFTTALVVAAVTKTKQYVGVVAAINPATYHLVHLTFFDFVFMFLTHYILFNSIYGLMYLHDEATFNVDKSNQNMELLYFTFVTSTSTGFGDITPKTNIARTVVIFQMLDAYLLFAFLITNFNSLVSNVRTVPTWKVSK